jgi:hypothetical protein
MKEVSLLKRAVNPVKKELGLLERKLWKYVFNFPYKKIFLLVLFIFLAYLIFRNPSVQTVVSSLGKLQYFGVFIAGMFFTFGFTTPFSAGFFIVLNPANPLLTALIGGMGAVIGDLAIFSFIRFSFMDEFKRLEKTFLIRKISQEMQLHFGSRIRLYLLYALAGLIIASPLPDEAGVIMLAGLTHIKPKVMVTISFIFNSLGILFLSLL